ncbi:hypothetical protein [Hymenobacter lucidus]|uniref:Uncharacterized protein n=1 Tax=Hymenobacter lucidus TaxID=2880930 RepID=A0ABS8ASR6_9BACT|nr:hypothetical protein [Hymenobacter lucidus]MCB2409260.1 hypothetical protein [Hymenobacter lucidus]
MQYLYPSFFSSYYLSALSDYSIHGTAQPALSETPDLGTDKALPASPDHPDLEAAAASAAVFAVGEYLVGDAEDTLLNGHPDIRY